MPDSAPVHITTRTGHVRVEADAAQTELAVSGGTTEVHDDGSIHVHRAPSESTIIVRCAPGTDVTVGTSSGKVDLSGPLGSVRVATISGKIHVAEAARLDVRSKSGKIQVDTCAGDLRVTTKSATVLVGHAGRATVAAVSGLVALGEVGGAEVKSISGKVLIGASGGERVSVRTVSGKVEIRVLGPGLPSTRLKSLSGKVKSELAPGDDFEIAVSSMSGTIKVSGA
jgi:DUF4097 and DUF4098 domain-containing protein YvlB